MTTPQSTKPAESPTRKTAKGFALKLAVVLVAVGVYFGLNGLEALKSYHNRPFMIVDGSGADDTEAKGFAPLRVERLSEELGMPPSGSADPLKADRAALTDMISQDLTYRPFKSEDEIVVALSDSIREHRDEEKRRLLSVQESMKKQLAAYRDEMDKVNERLSALISPEIKAEVSEAVTEKLTGKEKEKLIDEETAKLTSEERAKRVEAKIKELRDKNAASEARLYTLKNDKRAGTETEKTSLALYDARTKKEDLAMWLNTVAARESALANRNEEWKELDKRIKALDEAAQNRLRIANVTFRANLERSRGELRGQSARLLDIGPVFREGSGAYIIYQTCRTVALVLLVFAVLSVFLLLLRIIPFFAGASGTLTEQLGGVFKTQGGGGGEGGGGGVPQLARSIVMTAAALGVGTAVVVAGNSLSERGPRVAVAGSSTSDEPQDSYSPSYRPTNVKYDNGKTGKGGDAPTAVEFSPDIIYPEPLVIKHEVPVFVGGGGGGVLSLPTSVTDKIETLIGTGADVIRLTNTVKTAQATATEAKEKAEMAGVTAERAKEAAAEVSKTVGGQLKDITAVQVPALQKATAELQKESQYRGWQIFDMQNNVGRTLEGLSDTNVLLMGKQNSGGRNALTSTRQFFFKRNHYMVTGQVLTALRRVLCGSELCKARNFNDQAEVAAAEEKERLLTSLAAMMGQPPQTDGKFIDALKDSLYRQLNPGRERNGSPLAQRQADALKDWKSVILKYARVSY